MMEANRKAFMNLVIDADGMETDKFMDKRPDLKSLYDLGKLELGKMEMY